MKRRFRPARFFRGEGPRAGPITLDRSRVFILPTRYGVAFGLTLWFMLLASVNYNSSLGLTFTFLMGSLAVVSILHTYHDLVRLTLTVGRAEAVFAGQQARFPIHIYNGEARPRYSVRLSTGGAPASSSVVDVPSRHSDATLTRTAAERGRLPLGRVVVETRYPLGLFRAWSPLEFESRCLVYPRPSPEGPRRFPTGAEGEDGDRARGREDFSGLREYVPGDPPRQVHWKASARSESLLTKQFGAGGPAQLWLDWELLPGMAPEDRLSQLCRWVLDAHDAGRTWGLRLPGVEIGLARGAAHMHRCLGALACFDR